MDLSLLVQLTEVPGVSGREERVRDIMASNFIALSQDVRADAMGNMIAHLPGRGPRVALIAHMDEVGFLVSKIEDSGFIRVMPVGGIHPNVMGAQKVMVHGRRDIPGIVGSVPPHLAGRKEAGEHKEARPIEESFIDLGLTAAEVSDLVSVGDPVTFAAGAWENEHCLFARALDDRVGLFCMLAAVQAARKRDCDLFLVASTQEEYGLRGAGPSVFSIGPQIAVILEGTVAADTPGLSLPPNMQPTRLGGGPEIRLTDRRMIADRRLADFLVETADARGIPRQVIVKNTGATDASEVQTAASGVIAAAVSVPARYIHAPIGMVRKTDVAHAVDLVAAFLERASEFNLNVPYKTA